MDYTELQQRIVSLMKENTGRHPLDSGGAYGRNFERNQEKEYTFFEDIEIDENYCTIPVHRFMDTMLEINEQSEIFNETLTEYWTGAAYEELAEKFDISDNCHVGGEGNTYNSENDLSQDFQYYIFEYDGDYYCIFQLHGGCDIRGGYTSAQVFHVPEIDYFFLSWICDFYDDETDEHFETFYHMTEDDRTEWSEDKKCWLFEGREIYPYSSALGY